jgi:hypothetical protein
VSDPEAVIAEIVAAFETTEYPGDPYLQGSFEGCEPYEEVGPFQGKDWRSLPADFLDGHSAALSFFSEAGFRYFLPAYLVADLRDELQTADPVFHLTHGFSEISVDAPTSTRAFKIRSGKSVLLNPRRYGAMTFEDHARRRLSVFTREEAGAIVAYLGYRSQRDELVLDRDAIAAALHAFWLERMRSAPTLAQLRDHLREQEEYFEALKAARPMPGTD